MFCLRIAFSFFLVFTVSGAPIPTEELKEGGGGGREYIIKFKDDFDIRSSTAKISKHMNDFKLGSKVKWIYGKVLNGICLEDVSREALEWLQKQDFVDYVEESITFYSCNDECSIPTGSTVTQSSSFFDWGLDRISERQYSSSSYSFNPSAHGSGATIYILDTGVRTTHQEFGSNRASSFFSAFSDNGDCSGHGTAVAGVAAGDDLGTANEAKIKSVKVLNCYGEGNSSTIIAGLNAIATNGTAGNVSVISMSFASSTSSDSLQQVILNMSSNGYLFVAAAGNTHDYVIPYPAAYNKVISVGAINAKGKLPCFSNYGHGVDIYAPGANIYAATISGDANNKIKKVSGTSFAVPFVCGVAAVMIQKINDGTLSAGTNITAQIIADATTSVTIKNVPAGGFCNNRILYLS